MNIGLSTSVIQGGRSGVARYVFALVQALQLYATQHRFVLFVLEKDRPLFAFAECCMTLVSVPERFRPPVLDIMWHQSILPGLVRKYKLDILHVPSYRRMLYHAPCTLVATIHDLAAFHVSGKYDWPRMFYGRVVARRLASRQKRIIAVSQLTAGDLSRYYRLADGQVSVVRNGIDHNQFRPGDAGAARSWVAERHGVKKPFFLYIARLEHPAKNHVRLIRAFNRFKQETGSQWQLVLGGSDWHGAEVIHQCIRSSPYRDDIFNLGFVEETTLPTLYHAADVFVFPSLFEGFGLPPLEAMACGCPVLCSTRGALGEVTGDAAAVLDPEDEGDIQRQLMRLAGDSVLRANLQAAGFQHARQFTWEKAAADTLQVYCSRPEATVFAEKSTP